MPDQPNVLLVVTDQERYDLTAPDGPDVATPATDRLSREGLRCERAYTPTAICSPARVSMLTGLYPHNHGVLSNPTRDAIRTALPDCPTMGERARAAGYETDYVGKWHVEGSEPADAGFEKLTGWAHSDDQLLDTADHREFVRERGHDPDAVTTEGGVTDLPAEATQTGYLAERAIERLAEHAGGESPFLMRLDFPGPHGPYVAPQEYVDQYDPDDIDPWPSFAETFDGKPRVHEHHPEYYGAEDRSWSEWAETATRYFAFEHLIEDQFARVLDALDEFGLGEDTVVVRTADHGEFVGHHRQGNKGPLMYEDIYHVPMVVRWPGVAEAGATTDAFVELQDLMPTVCDLAGTDIPETDGRSLRPVFAGEQAEWRDAAFAEYHGEPETLYTQRMVRTDRHKFVFNGPDRNELYDLETDPHELTNLVDHPEYQDVRQDLAERLGDWMERTDDDIGVGRYRNRCT
jgi:arylsulfatase A-like enzyme